MSSKDNSYANTDKKTLFLSDDVDNESIGKLTWSILQQIREDDEKDEKEKDYKREPIKLYINSYGGSVSDMWGLIDVILNSKTPIYTYCTGYAMSAAFKIFLAGHKRYCYKHSTFMYHQMSCWRSGKYQDLVEDREEMDWLNKKIEEYVIDRTNLTKDDINEIREKKKDFYIHSDTSFNISNNSLNSLYSFINIYISASGSFPHSSRNFIALSITSFCFLYSFLQASNNLIKSSL